VAPGAIIGERRVRLVDCRVLGTGAVYICKYCTSVGVAILGIRRVKPEKFKYLPRRTNVRREVDPIKEHGGVAIGHFDLVHWASGETVLLEQNT
jgi:hypothetical protein